MNAFCTLAVGTVAGLLVAGSIGAQGPADGTQAKKLQMMAKDADPGWEVVTVKPSDPNNHYDRFDAKGRTIVIENNTVEAMLRFGYGVQRSQIAGAPDWIRTERFDAKGTSNVEGQPDLKQFQSLIQKLLAERFGLKAHHEQRDIAVYALTVAKGGPAIRTECRTTAVEQRQVGVRCGGTPTCRWLTWR